MTRAGRKAKNWAGIGKKIAPARFLLFVGVLLAAYFALRSWLPGDDWREGAAIAFDAAALVFLLSLAPLLRDCDPASMRRHSADNDANRALILVITSGLTLVAMAAITGELKGAQHGEFGAMVKLVSTLLLIWGFANSVYALHYAHAYYGKDADSGSDSGGIDFPKTRTPDYWDFAYFAFTLGMTFQTSDVQITATPIRKVALAHCFAAFIFNIGVIAFTINVLGGSS
jgi:uncharacterized membrane protein